MKKIYYIRFKSGLTEVTPREFRSYVKRGYVGYIAREYREVVS